MEVAGFVGHLQEHNCPVFRRGNSSREGDIGHVILWARAEPVSKECWAGRVGQRLYIFVLLFRLEPKPSATAGSLRIRTLAPQLGTGITL